MVCAIMEFKWLVLEFVRDLGIHEGDFNHFWALWPFCHGTDIMYIVQIFYTVRDFFYVGWKERNYI